MTRVTSALVLVALLGAVTARLGCAWSCQPSPIAAATTHCHETSMAALEFSASGACNDIRSGSPVLAAVVRPDTAMFATIDRLTSVSFADDDRVRSRPLLARANDAAPPPAFAIPLRQ